MIVELDRPVPGLTRRTYGELKRLLDSSSQAKALKLRGSAVEQQRIYRSLYMFYWRHGLTLRRAKREAACYLWIEDGRDRGHE